MLATEIRHTFVRECPACAPFNRASDLPCGARCGGCGHHFHFGKDLLVTVDPIPCPRCGAACSPLTFDQDPVNPRSNGHVAT